MWWAVGKVTRFQQPEPTLPSPFEPLLAHLESYFGRPYPYRKLDVIASVIIGLILAGTAIWLAYETKGLLIGESANVDVVQGIRKLASQLPEVAKVNEVLTMHMGPNFILVNVSANFVDHIVADKIEATIARLDGEIKAAFPEVKRVFVEAEARSANRSHATTSR